jgi:hypothetical protein
VLLTESAVSSLTVDCQAASFVWPVNIASRFILRLLEAEPFQSERVKCFAAKSHTYSESSRKGRSWLLSIYHPRRKHHVPGARPRTDLLRFLKEFVIDSSAIPGLLPYEFLRYLRDCL